MIGVGAMNAFEAGRAGGEVSGLYGVGGAIKGMLAHARKVGLIQEQAQGNLMSSMGAASVKQGVQRDYDNEMTETPIFSPTGEPIGTAPHKRGVKPFIQKEKSAEEKYYQLAYDDEMKDRAEKEAAAAEAEAAASGKNLAPKKVINGKTYQKVEGGWQLIK